MTEHILSLSYGKDSLACLGAIEQLGWPLDRIVHAEVWATDDIPADLPPMVEFKAKADKIIKERWGIEVEHVCALRPSTNRSSRERGGAPAHKATFERCFYTPISKQAEGFEYKLGLPRGFPFTKGGWCLRDLKLPALRLAEKADLRGRVLSGVQRNGIEGSREDLRLAFSSRSMVQQQTQGEGVAEGQSRERQAGVVQYIGIAADELKRLSRLDGKTKASPLAAIGWDEAYCRRWCEDNDLLSPIYTTATRGGCWFCHNQGVGQLRLLRKNYPELWALILKWDLDSPVSFKADGHTVHDFDRRFQMEDDGFVSPDERWKWEYLDSELVNYRLF